MNRSSRRKRPNSRSNVPGPQNCAYYKLLRTVKQPFIVVQRLTLEEIISHCGADFKISDLFNNSAQPEELSPEGDQFCDQPEVIDYGDDYNSPTEKDQASSCDSFATTKSTKDSRSAVVIGSDELSRPNVSDQKSTTMTVPAADTSAASPSNEFDEADCYFDDPAIYEQPDTCIVDDHEGDEQADPINSNLNSVRQLDVPVSPVSKPTDIQASGFLPKDASPVMDSELVDGVLFRAFDSFDAMESFSRKDWDRTLVKEDLETGDSDSQGSDFLGVFNDDKTTTSAVEDLLCQDDSINPDKLSSAGLIRSEVDETGYKSVSHGVIRQDSVSSTSSSGSNKSDDTENTCKVSWKRLRGLPRIRVKQESKLTAAILNTASHFFSDDLEKTQSPLHINKESLCAVSSPTANLNNSTCESKRLREILIKDKPTSSVVSGDVYVGSIDEREKLDGGTEQKAVEIPLSLSSDSIMDSTKNTTEAVEIPLSLSSDSIVDSTKNTKVAVEISLTSSSDSIIDSTKNTKKVKETVKDSTLHNDSGFDTTSASVFDSLGDSVQKIVEGEPSTSAASNLNPAFFSSSLDEFLKSQSSLQVRYLTSHAPVLSMPTNPQLISVSETTKVKPLPVEETVAEAVADKVVVTERTKRRGRRFTRIKRRRTTANSNRQLTVKTTAASNREFGLLDTNSVSLSKENSMVTDVADMHFVEGESSAARVNPISWFPRGKLGGDVGVKNVELAKGPPNVSDCKQMASSVFAESTRVLPSTTETPLCTKATLQPDDVSNTIAFNTTINTAALGQLKQEISSNLKVPMVKISRLQMNEEDADDSQIMKQCVKVSLSRLPNGNYAVLKKQDKDLSANLLWRAVTGAREPPALFVRGPKTSSLAKEASANTNNAEKKQDKDLSANLLWRAVTGAREPPALLVRGPKTSLAKEASANTTNAEATLEKCLKPSHEFSAQKEQKSVSFAARPSSSRSFSRPSFRANKLISPPGMDTATVSQTATTSSNNFDPERAHLIKSWSLTREQLCGVGRLFRQSILIRPTHNWRPVATSSKTDTLPNSSATNAHPVTRLQATEPSGGSTRSENIISAAKATTTPLSFQCRSFVSNTTAHEGSFSSLSSFQSHVIANSDDEISPKQDDFLSLFDLRPRKAETDRDRANAANGAVVDILNCIENRERFERCSRRHGVRKATAMIQQSCSSGSVDSELKKYLLMRPVTRSLIKAKDHEQQSQRQFLKPPTKPFLSQQKAAVTSAAGTTSPTQHVAGMMSTSTMADFIRNMPSFSFKKNRVGKKKLSRALRVISTPYNVQNVLSRNYQFRRSIQEKKKLRRRSNAKDQCRRSFVIAKAISTVESASSSNDDDDDVSRSSSSSSSASTSSSGEEGQRAVFNALRKRNIHAEHDSALFIPPTLYVSRREGKRSVKPPERFRESFEEETASIAANWRQFAKADTGITIVHEPQTKKPCILRSPSQQQLLAKPASKNSLQKPLRKTGSSTRSSAADNNDSSSSSEDESSLPSTSKRMATQFQQQSESRDELLFPLRTLKPQQQRLSLHHYHIDLTPPHSVNFFQQARPSSEQQSELRNALTHQVSPSQQRLLTQPHIRGRPRHRRAPPLPLVQPRPNSAQKRKLSSHVVHHFKEDSGVVSSSLSSSSESDDAPPDPPQISPVKSRGTSTTLLPTLLPPSDSGVTQQQQLIDISDIKQEIVDEDESEVVLEVDGQEVPYSQIHKRKANQPLEEYCEPSTSSAGQQPKKFRPTVSFKRIMEEQVKKARQLESVIRRHMQHNRALRLRLQFLLQNGKYSDKTLNQVKMTFAKYQEIIERQKRRRAQMLLSSIERRFTPQNSVFIHDIGHSRDDEQNADNNTSTDESQTSNDSDHQNQVIVTTKQNNNARLQDEIVVASSSSTSPAGTHTAVGDDEISQMDAATNSAQGRDDQEAPPVIITAKSATSSVAVPHDDAGNNSGGDRRYFVSIENDRDVEASSPSYVASNYSSCFEQLPQDGGDSGHFVETETGEFVESDVTKVVKALACGDDSVLSELEWRDSMLPPDGEYIVMPPGISEYNVRPPDSEHIDTPPPDSDFIVIPPMASAAPQQQEPVDQRNCMVVERENNDVDCSRDFPIIMSASVRPSKKQHRRSSNDDDAGFAVKSSLPLPSRVIDPLSEVPSTSKLCARLRRPFWCPCFQDTKTRSTLYSTTIG